MSLEIELHTIPHLKGLINVSNISGQQKHGSMDSIHQAKLKTNHFTSYRANRTNTFLLECTSRCPGIEPGLFRSYRFCRPGFNSRTKRSMCQLWWPAVLKPFAIKGWTLHFWKIPTFIYVVLAAQSNSFTLNVWKLMSKMATFITVYVLAMCRLLQIAVYPSSGHFAYLFFLWDIANDST